jgi:hypothetical protein
MTQDFFGITFSAAQYPINPFFGGRNHWKTIRPFLIEKILKLIRGVIQVNSPNA